MDLIVNGGKKLSGTVTPSGNKNAVVSIIPATILTDEPVTLKNVPDLSDVQGLVEIMRKLGSDIDWDKDNSTMRICNKNLNLKSFDGNLPIGMRASVMLLCPLVSRFHKLEVQFGIKGCPLGMREIDPNLEMLNALGTKVETFGNNIFMDAGSGLKGGDYWADFMGVTSTENFVMAAVCAKGTSILMNAASEPHVQDLCKFLNSMGAKIKGAGSSRLEIEGVPRLKGTTHTIINDHHEITTFLALGAMTGGRLEVKKALPEHFGLVVRSFDKFGVEIKYDKDTAVVERNQSMKIKIPYTANFVPKIEAHPWPYFAVDLLPLMVALATRAEGQMMFWNKMYDNGNSWVPELTKFGVKYLMCDPHRVLIWGGVPLHPAEVNAPEIIRATVAMLMIALTIEGRSVIHNADSIMRAHPGFAEKLVDLGAEVTWV